MSGPTTHAPMTLTPQRTVEVAHALISEHGLDWFSMRKLAAALDVNPMTVYLRFRNKEELLDAVAREALATIELPELADGSWEEQALQLATCLRSHLLADRNLLQVYAASDRLSSALLHTVDRGLQLMERAGYEGEQAVLAFRSLFWHTVGFTLVDSSASAYVANEPGGIDDDHLFAHTTRLLIDGLLAEASRHDPLETIP